MDEDRVTAILSDDCLFHQYDSTFHKSKETLLCESTPCH